MANEEKIKNDPQVKEILYGRPLDKQQLDAILDNFTNLRVLYHSTSSGLKFQGDSMIDDALLVLKGSGETTEVTAQQLKDIMTKYPVHAKLIYELFSKGVLTFETFENTNKVFEEYFENQENIEATTDGIIGQFNTEGTFINTGSGKDYI